MSTPTASPEVQKVRSGLMWTIFILVGTVILGVATYKLWTYEPKQKLVEGAMSSSQQRAVGDCTAARPCDGPIGKMAKIPLGKKPCFDPSIWSNFEGFKMTVSGQGRGEHRYACANVQAAAEKTCKDEHDEFRFDSAPGVTPPRYYFIDQSRPFC